MATLTQVKRDRYWARYARKDARCEVFAALYGRQQHTYDRHPFKRSNDPAQDTTREMSVFWEPHTAKAKLEAHAAAFNAKELKALEERLTALTKAYKRKQQTETAHD